MKYSIAIALALIVGIVTFQNCGKHYSSSQTVDSEVLKKSGCTFNSEALESGETTLAYKDSTVPVGASCEFEVRTCDNGVLSGSFTFSDCTIEAGPTCLVSDTQRSRYVHSFAFNSTTRKFEGWVYDIVNSCRRLKLQIKIDGSMFETVDANGEDPLMDEIFGSSASYRFQSKAVGAGTVGSKPVEVYDSENGNKILTEDVTF